MWRAVFLALGAYCCLLGIEAMLMDKAVLANRSGSAGGAREIVPSEWAPWSLLSAGAVTILYTFTLPKRVKE
jgi:hypothetical protein